MQQHHIRILSFFARPHVAVGGAFVLSAALLGATYALVQVAPSGAYASVGTRTITQEVDVSGTVEAAQNTDLAFQVPGRISSIPVAVGSHVFAGQTLLALDGAAQRAALAQAQAALLVQQANLAQIESGTRPEQLALDETNVAQANIAVQNALQSAYVATDAAIHAQADQVFTNPRTSSADLAFSIPDATLVATVKAERIALEPTLSVWAHASTTDSVAAATTADAYLAQAQTFLDDLSRALAETPAGAVPASALIGYEASVNTARASVASARSGLSSAVTGYKSAAGMLTIAQAGATPEALAAQKAAVAVAQAAVAAAQVAVNQTVLAAPISGIVTVQNANPGQTVAVGVPLVSLVADGNYEAKARVSDADIAKLKLGDEADVTFDAYPGVVFPATVTTVDPAATMQNGVLSYGMTVTFTNNDPRLSSGLSANVHVKTATQPDVLAVPVSAVITNATSTFVYVQGAHAPTKVPVTLGVRGGGYAEVLSGLSAGQRVLTFGASANQ